MATINVTTTVDENNGTGNVSLREAVIQANGSVGDDTIVLGANQTYNLTQEGFGENASATGDLDILSGGGKLTILVSTVSGSTVTATINARGIDRIFDVQSGASLNLQNLKIEGGKPIGSNFIGDTFISDGGGIYNAGTLNLSNVVITSNTASGGGGIACSGTMNVSQSTISSNFANSCGGGILNYATINIINSNIHSNSAPSCGGGIYSRFGTINIANSTISSNSAHIGGGILNHDTMYIANSTIHSNSAHSGGGIDNSAISYPDTISPSRGIMNITNSTISSNSASNYGGGIRNKAGELNLKNTTIAGNTSITGSGLLSSGSYVSRGFDMYYELFADLSINNSIIAQNYQNKDVDIDTLTSITNEGYNLIGNGIGVEQIFNKTGDKIGTDTNPLDAKLGPLQNNGGLTKTHALLAGSPAINAGNTDLTADQWGYERDAIPDIGAYEYLETTPPSGATTGPDLLIGTEGPDTIDGLAGNDTIAGLGGNDCLFGSDGDDSINGGAGDDTMIGGVGNDTYIVNIARDRVTEALNAGRDSIFSTMTYKLPANVENLALQGTTAINGTGNGLHNRISGNNVANKINGGAGNDTLTGLGGSDSLTGDTGNDRLDGGGGNDTLLGNAGNDKMKGGTGADRFVYNTNKIFATSVIGVDTITDFTKSQSDKIVLGKTTFTKISSIAGSGFSVISEFASVTTTPDTSGADIVYNSATGELFYNQNGTAAGYGTGGKFLTLINKPTLSASDFIIQA